MKKIPRQTYKYFVVRANVLEKDKDTVKLNDEVLKKAMFNKIDKYYGNFGTNALETGFRVKYLSDSSRILIVRCKDGPHNFLLSILPIIKIVGGFKVKLELLFTGATVASCNAYIFNIQLPKNIVDEESVMFDILQHTTVF